MCSRMLFLGIPANCNIFLNLRYMLSLLHLLPFNVTKNGLSNDILIGSLSRFMTYSLRTVDKVVSNGISRSSPFFVSLRMQ